MGLHLGVPKKQNEADDLLDHVVATSIAASTVWKILHTADPDRPVHSSSPRKQRNPRCRLRPS